MDEKTSRTVEKQQEHESNAQTNGRGDADVDTDAAAKRAFVEDRIEALSSKFQAIPGAVAVDGPTPDGEQSPGEAQPRSDENNEASGETDTSGDVEALTSNEGNPAESHASSSWPVAEEYKELPVVTAELVKQPESAILYQVDIDGDEEKQASKGTPKTKEELPPGSSTSWKKLVALIGVVVVATAVVVTVVLSASDSSTDEIGVELGYECYTSTLDLLTAQIEAGPDAPMEPLIICPNTNIQIGTFRNPSRNDFNYTNGDYSISALRPNVTIQCGLDGRRENNCTLTGGLAHVVNQNPVYHPEFGYQYVTSRVDGFLVKGLTFTGNIQASGVFGGIPAALSHPGSTRFEDCAWVDLTATKRLIAVGQNYLLELQGIQVPDMSIELTISNCLFDNIIYEEEFLLNIYQILRVEDTVFRNIKLPELLPDGCYIHPNGCRNLMHCRTGGPSVCSVHNVCVEDADVTGAAPFLIGDETGWSNTGTNLWYGPAEYMMAPTSNETNNNFFDTDMISETEETMPPFSPDFSPISENEPVEGTESDGGQTDQDGVAEFNPISGLQPIPGNEPIDGEQPFFENTRFCALGVARMIENSSAYDCLDEPIFTSPRSGTCP